LYSTWDINYLNIIFYFAIFGTQQPHSQYHFAAWKSKTCKISLLCHTLKKNYATGLDGTTQMQVNASFGEVNLKEL